MKKNLIILLVCLLCISCERLPTNCLNDTNKIPGFVVINKEIGYFIVYDEETLVEYVVSDMPHNQNTFTLLVDSLGRPKLYKK